MESNTATLFEKLQGLPVDQLPAVENFIDRLLAQSEPQQVVTAMEQAVEPSQSQQEQFGEVRFGSDAQTISIAADFDDPVVDFQDYL